MKEIIKTEDGSDTLKDTILNETYHSVKGAFQESLHVYIENGFKKIKKYKISILEVGMGTGLNVMLSLFHKTAEQTVHYQAIEPYPLEPSLLKQLNYFTEPQDQETFRKLHELPYDQELELEPQFFFQKSRDKIQDFDSHELYNLIYYDAFAPLKQPDMWHIDILDKMYDLLDHKGVLVTYCAQGQFKRDLQEVGFTVESPPGPHGKRQITRAIKK